MRGEVIKQLLDERLCQGEHRILFNGSGLASGIYLAQVQTEETVQKIRMILVK